MTSLSLVEGFRFVGGLDCHAQCSLSSTLPRSWAVPGTERMKSGWMRNKRIRPLDETATAIWMKMGHDTRGRNARRDENQMNRHIQDANEKLNAEGRPMKKSMAGGGVPLSGARKAVRCSNIDGEKRSAVVEKGPSWSIAVGARERARGRGRPGGAKAMRTKELQISYQPTRFTGLCIAFHFISSRRVNLVLITNISIFLFKFGLFWAENGEIHHMCIRLVSASILASYVCTFVCPVSLWRVWRSALWIR